MTYEKIEINRNTNLILLKNPNFKTTLITVYVQRPLEKDQVSKNSVLPSLMAYSTKNYSDNLSFTKKQMELYGTTVSGFSSKISERNLLKFRITAPSDNYLPQKQTDQLVDLVKEILYNPNVDEKGFRDDQTNIQVQISVEEVKSLINNKEHYCIQKLIENMFKGEAYAINEYGYLDEYEKINGQNIYAHYQDIISSSPIDIVVAGDFDENLIKEQFTEKFKDIDSKDKIIINEEKLHKTVKSQKIVENMDIVQSKIALGYSTNISPEDEKIFSALRIANSILGGGAHSKLFLNVREKHSLCYSISSSLASKKGALVVSCGVEHQNIDKAIELIGKELQDIKDGNITDKEFESAKLYFINSMNQLKDSIYAVTEYNYLQTLEKKPKTLDENIELIKNVQKEEIQQVAKDITLDTTYILTK